MQTARRSARVKTHRQVEAEIEILLVLVEDTQAHQPPDEGVALEDAAGIRLVEGQQLTGSGTDFLWKHAAVSTRGRGCRAGSSHASPARHGFSPTAAW